MHCRDVRPLLVAHADGELSISGHLQIAEHLDHCWRCRALAGRLEAITPRDELRVPDQVHDQLAARVHATRLRAFADRTPMPASVRSHVAGWLFTTTPVSRLSISMYAAALVAALGWAMLSQVGADVPDAPTVASPTLPAGQFRPASYVPPEADEADAASPARD